MFVDCQILLVRGNVILWVTGLFYYNARPLIVLLIVDWDVRNQGKPQKLIPHEQ